jgi:FkbM family methyltransferase
MSPEHPGKLPFSRWLGAKLFPENGAVFEVDGKIRMYLHTDDWIDFVLLRSGIYEPLTLAFLKQNLLPGQRALLAGVNNGLHVIVSARCVGPTGIIIGVEPQPRSIYKAYRNIQLNHLEADIRLVAGALGNRSELLPMADAPKDNSATASLFHSPSRTAFAIFADSVPAILARTGVTKIDLMLLDVEGYEMNVLNGFTEDCRPPLVIVEVNPPLLKEQGLTDADIHGVLARLGYGCWSLDGRAAVAGEPLPEQNLIAVRNGAKSPLWIRV